MKALLLVGLGGALGSMARHALAVLMLQGASTRFPFGTLAVNVLGCVIAGVLAGLSERHGWLGADARLFVFAGLLGGFTTFSAFGLDAVALMRRGETGMAFGYVVGSVVLGLVGAWVGMRVALR
jgi:CrcB protein